MLRLSLAGVISSEIEWRGPLPAAAGIGAGFGRGPDFGVGLGVGVGLAAGDGCRTKGGSIEAEPAAATRCRERSKNSPPTNAISPAKIASHVGQLLIQPAFTAEPCGGRPGPLSARLGSDVEDGRLSRTGSAGVRSRDAVGGSVPDTVSAPGIRCPGVARAAGVKRLVSVCWGAGVRIVGNCRCAGAGAGVGVERAVGITRGATGTGPSMSTGPWTCGVAVAVGLGAGGNWKPAGGVPVATGVAAAGALAPASTKRLHCAIMIAKKKGLCLEHIFQGWVRQNRAISKAALNRD